MSVIWEKGVVRPRTMTYSTFYDTVQHRVVRGRELLETANVQLPVIVVYVITEFTVMRHRAE